MEKRRPHFDLTLVHRLAADPAALRFTRVALDGAAELELGTSDIREIIRTLRHLDFYKSMTTHADHMVWQDVYRPYWNGCPLYIKLTVYTEQNLLVVSFKRR